MVCVESISNKSLFFMVLSCHVRVSAADPETAFARAEDGSQIDAGIMQETYMTDVDDGEIVKLLVYYAILSIHGSTYIDNMTRWYTLEQKTVFFLSSRYV